MVVIRLSRGGSKHRPFYNIVVADKQVRRDGRFIERVNYWIGVGAQPSPTVQRLIKSAPEAGAAQAAAPAAA